MYTKFMDQVDHEGYECTVRTSRNGFTTDFFTVETGRDTGHFRDLSEEEQAIALRWLHHNVYSAKSVLGGHTSYGMKHILQDRTNIYMTNNQFKELMLICGFYPADADELNWRFYIKKSSPIFQLQPDGRCGLAMLGEPMDYSAKDTDDRSEADWEYDHGSWQCSACGAAPNKDDY